MFLLALAVVFPLQSLEPPPASSATPSAASSATSSTASCTGWPSRDLPPETIRVGRRDGSVETVDFRTYVGMVMAKEWPGWVPAAARAAGAVA